MHIVDATLRFANWRFLLVVVFSTVEPVSANLSFAPREIHRVCSRAQFRCADLISTVEVSSRVARLAF